eukprot:m.16272 g.16272  ORF g.16272 m.16272 type:complete len:364 (+) comp5651_c0_seq1:82-1173(+)
MAYTRSCIVSVFAILAVAAPSCNGLSLFLRTTWLNEVGEQVWRPWFELIKRGRLEGPSSPFYIEDLALQNTACCNSPAKYRGCLGPKCSDLGYEPYSLLHREIDQLQEYFPLFDKVHIGTTIMTGLDLSNRTMVDENAALSARIGKEFLERYGNITGTKYGWYLTDEGSVPDLGMDKSYRTDMFHYLSSSMKALKAVKDMDFLWSPSNGDVSLNASQRVTVENGLEDLFCGGLGEFDAPIALHFQDWLGQSVSFEFPFYYNYSTAFTCEKDTVPTYASLDRIRAKCPQGLREVKVNVEMFAERLNNGEHGEDNGANIINADPREIASRLECYRKNNLPLGASWAINHWYGLMTYVNQTVYHPY